jgi:hypothetical protein
MKVVQTLYGTFNDDQLKVLSNAISEINVCMEKVASEKEAIKDIVNAVYDELKIPKKIVNRMAKAQYRQSFSKEVVENKEFEALFETTFNLKTND